MIFKQALSGDIDCGFELLVSGNIDAKELQGIVGSSGADLNVSTFSGDISINKF